jgi:hypothetical protein
MTPDEDLQFSCPSCNSEISLEQGIGEVLCKVCGAISELRGHLCPVCLAYQQHEGTLCISCGAPLTRTCQNCFTANWSGAESCNVCGDAIDIIAIIGYKGKLATARRLNKQMDQAQAIKAAEELASNKRMTEMLAIEEARQAQIRQRMAKQKSQERKLLIIVFGGVALFFLFLIAYTIVSSVSQ